MSMKDETETKPNVSAVIVNFNGGEVLTHAVAGVLSSPMLAEVFVVDNRSTDGSIERLRAIHGGNERLVLIENDENIGFTRASNVGLRRARGDFVLLLNPDCFVEQDTLNRMLATLEQYPDAGMAGCLIRNEDGSEQAGCRRSIPTPWRALVRVLHLDMLFPNHPRLRNFVLTCDPMPDRPVYVEAISGAFMLVRREVLEQVGFLDEGYFLHCDDLDWCMRFQKADWKILFVPGVEVVHYRGLCSKSRPIFVEWHKHKGMMRFYRKFFYRHYPGVLFGLVAMGVWLRFGLVAGHRVLSRAGRILGLMRD